MKKKGLFRRKKEFEEIEYKPKTVKEMLIKMKDISELIVDLAYAAIIFDSQDLANEVNNLELKMDKLLYQIRMSAMLAARSTKDAEQLSGILQVASAAENISNAAGDICELLETNIEERPFLPFYFAEADEKIRSVHVNPSSTMVNRQVRELAVETETGMRIIAIKRINRWFYGIEPTQKLKEHDLLVVRGVEEGFLELKRYASGQEPWPQCQPDQGGMCE